MKQILAAVALSACALSASPSAATPRDVWFANLTALCGQTFEGRVVTTDAADADFAGKRLTMQVRDCSPEEIRIPFAVGEDRSRTWIITKTADGVRLKHDHRGVDGKPDGLHWYGGTSTEAGSDSRQDFPVDAFSVEMFTAWDASVSNTNVWALEVHPGTTAAYELRRANRHFRVEFDLAKPVSD